MAATKTTDFSVNAREIDFVTRFSRTWETLQNIMGISQAIQAQPGTVLKSKYAEVTLSASAAEGEEIPYSAVKVKEKTYGAITVEKYAKATTIEAIQNYGYDVAIQKSDDEFLYQLTDKVCGKFFDYIKTGTLTGTPKTFQSALATAKGAVENKFKGMHRASTGVVGFVNVMDFYEYLGEANITVQTEFGFQYIKNFMGYNAIFLLSDHELEKGKVIATPINNLCLYYVNPADSAFANSGLVYTTDADTNLIGFHTQGNYNTAVSESFAIMGVTLFAEYLDGIAVETITAG